MFSFATIQHFMYVIQIIYTSHIRPTKQARETSNVMFWLVANFYPSQTSEMSYNSVYWFMKTHLKLLSWISAYFTFWWPWPFKKATNVNTTWDNASAVKLKSLPKHYALRSADVHTAYDGSVLNSLHWIMTVVSHLEDNKHDKRQIQAMTLPST